MIPIAPFVASGRLSVDMGYRIFLKDLGQPAVHSREVVLCSTAKIEEREWLSLFIGEHERIVLATSLAAHRAKILPEHVGVDGSSITELTPSCIGRAAQ